MAIQAGDLIGSGAGSDVYEYGEDRVIKLYKPGVGHTAYEYKKTLLAYENGLPVPRVFGLVTHHGKSFLAMMTEHIAGCHEMGMPWEDHSIQRHSKEKQSALLADLKGRLCSA